jgi:NADH-quinone oxidoreductase subunit L
MIIGIPLLASVICGFWGKRLGSYFARLPHRLACAGILISFLLSVWMLYDSWMQQWTHLDVVAYPWLTVGKIQFELGFLIDRLTLLMMCIVTFVSLMVHLYTIGYMADDPGYTRFFSYISFFTAAMLILVMANNFLQLFIGWEGVGLASYLLIGFWFQKETAVFANLKAFIVNRVGDFGFLLGVAAVFMYFNTLHFQSVFDQIPVFSAEHSDQLTTLCVLLFVGAMAKSAQIPLHVWLPDSMEGPTPISALIHAATMVTAGIFMVARLSPIFEYSTTARSVILIIGALTALLMGFLGMVQSDIKRIIAYSTISQLGYMVVALGVSAYAAAVFHLFTHAFFKALLFLGAGSVIHALHHEQDIWKMGGLRSAMPITYWTMLLGSLSLIGCPLFSGFYSKDMIIEAVGHSQLMGAQCVYYAILSGVFVTAFYTFRLFFVVFHGAPRAKVHTKPHTAAHESGWVMTLPLMLLAIPSVCIGAVCVYPLLFDQSPAAYFQQSILVLPAHDVLSALSTAYPGFLSMAVTALFHPPFFLMVLGVWLAAGLYLYPVAGLERLVLIGMPLRPLLDIQYGFNVLNERILAPMIRQFSVLLGQECDMGLIDQDIVEGSAKGIHHAAFVLRRLQSGYLYHYAFLMIVGLLGLLSGFIYFVFKI